MNKAAALKMARDAGLSVSTTKANGITTIQVGSETVSYDPEKGGSACWMLNGVRPCYDAYVGNVIELAVRKQTA